MLDTGCPLLPTKFGIVAVSFSSLHTSIGFDVPLKFSLNEIKTIKSLLSEILTRQADQEVVVSLGGHLKMLIFSENVKYTRLYVSAQYKTIYSPISKVILVTQVAW